MVYDLSLDNNVFVESNLHAALQELDLLFNTEVTEVLGEVQFGVSLESFLWDLTPREDDLKQYIETKISSYCYYMNEFDWEVTVSVNEDDEISEARAGKSYNPNSIYIVTIDLYSKDDTLRQNKYSTKVIQF